jgi:hypothetical protein
LSYSRSLDSHVSLCPLVVFLFQCYGFGSGFGFFLSCGFLGCCLCLKSSCRRAVWVVFCVSVVVYSSSGSVSLSVPLSVSEFIACLRSSLSSSTFSLHSSAICIDCSGGLFVVSDIVLLYQCALHCRVELFLQGCLEWQWRRFRVLLLPGTHVGERCLSSAGLSCSRSLDSHLSLRLVLAVFVYAFCVGRVLCFCCFCSVSLFQCPSFDIGFGFFRSCGFLGCCLSSSVLCSGSERRGEFPPILWWQGCLEWQWEACQLFCCGEGFE